MIKKELHLKKYKLYARARDCLTEMYNDYYEADDAEKALKAFEEITGIKTEEDTLKGKIVEVKLDGKKYKAKIL